MAWKIRRLKDVIGDVPRMSKSFPLLRHLARSESLDVPPDGMFSRGHYDRCVKDFRSVSYTGPSLTPARTDEGLVVILIWAGKSALSERAPPEKSL